MPHAITHDTAEAELVIVGAGPTGLYASYYAGFRGLTSVVIDSLPHPGGQVSALYPEKVIYDVPAHPAIKGQDLVENLLAQAGPFDPGYLLGHTASTLSHDGQRWIVETDPGATVRAGAVLVAAGIGRFTPRLLPCASPYRGRGLHSHVPRLEEHRGRDVVVVGGGDSAIDWALALDGVAASVTVVHRRPAFRAHAHSVAMLRRSPVRVLTDSEVVACHGEQHLTHVDVRSPDGAARLPAQTLGGDRRRSRPRTWTARRGRRQPTR